MKKWFILLVALILTSCANTDKEVYNIEATLLNGTIDTFKVEVRYNRDLRNVENNLVKSEMFNEEGINNAISLAYTHPLGIFYKDTIERLKPSLVQFSKISKNYDDPLGAKLIDNSIVFNKSLVIDRNKGQIESFNVLSKTNYKLNVEVGVLDKKLLDFVNDPNVTVEDLDAIPYVSQKAAINIVGSRPIKSVYDLNKIPYVSDEAIKRIRLYAEKI